MIYIAVDHIHPVTGRPMPNGIPIELHDQIDHQDGYRLDFPRIIYYLYDCKIPSQIVLTTDAPVNSWYPIVLGRFDFSQDYINLISPSAFDRIKKKEMLLIFTYHEGDHPGRIRQRLIDLCEQHGIDREMTWLISGNSSADQYENSVYWPELEFMYWRTVDRGANAQYHLNPRSRAYTGLCRIDKLWRKVFMSDLWSHGLHKQGYFSYTQHLLGGEDNYYDCALRNSYLAQCQPRVDQFIASGPFLVDDLDSRAHNTYNQNMTDLYKDSYFNIVLETMIDVDDSGGQFITEKTFKPIFNNQFFVAVSSADHLRHLRDLGYQTFGRYIDESYDSNINNQDRFEAVLDLTKSLIRSGQENLHQLYIDLAPEIRHNAHVFKTGMAHRLQAVVDRINYKP
jgi:hypothetical protein